MDFENNECFTETDNACQKILNVHCRENETGHGKSNDR